MSPGSVSFAADLRAVLRHGDFRRLFATRLCSQASDGLFQVALAAYVLFSPERATTGADAAAAFAVLLLPYSLVGPFAGVLLDRWRRRQVLVYANAVRAALVVAVAGLTIAGATGPVFYIGALGVLSVNRFYLAALSAALPHVVERDELVMANSVSTTSGALAAIGGGGLGFVLALALGDGVGTNATIMGCAAAGYLLASTVAATMGKALLGPHFDPDRPGPREAVRHVAAGIADGARHVLAHRPAAHALAAITAQRFLYGVSTVAVLLLYRNYFNDPGDVDAALAGLGVAFAASGLGFFTAAVVTPAVTPRIGKPAWIVVCFAAAAVVELALGLPYAQAPLVIAAFAFGVVAQAVKICVDTIVQEAIDDGYRGRVFSFLDIAFNVSFVAAATVAALALPPSGKSYPVLVAITISYVVLAVLYARSDARSDARPAGSSRDGPGASVVGRRSPGEALARRAAGR